MLWEFSAFFLSRNFASSSVPREFVMRCRLAISTSNTASLPSQVVAGRRRTYRSTTPPRWKCWPRTLPAGGRWQPRAALTNTIILSSANTHQSCTCGFRAVNSHASWHAVRWRSVTCTGISWRVVGEATRRLESARCRYRPACTMSSKAGSSERFRLCASCSRCSGASASRRQRRRSDQVSSRWCCEICITEL